MGNKQTTNENTNSSSKSIIKSRNFLNNISSDIKLHNLNILQKSEIKNDSLKEDSFKEDKSISLLQKFDSKIKKIIIYKTSKVKFELTFLDLVFFPVDLVFMEIYEKANKGELNHDDFIITLGKDNVLKIIFLKHSINENNLRFFIEMIKLTSKICLDLEIEKNKGKSILNIPTKDRSENFNFSNFLYKYMQESDNHYIKTLITKIQDFSQLSENCNDLFLKDGKKVMNFIGLAFTEENINENINLSPYFIPREYREKINYKPNNNLTGMSKNQKKKKSKNPQIQFETSKISVGNNYIDIVNRIMHGQIDSKKVKLEKKLVNEDFHINIEKTYCDFNLDFCDYRIQDNICLLDNYLSNKGLFVKEDFIINIMVKSNSKPDTLNQRFSSIRSTDIKIKKCNKGVIKEIRLRPFVNDIVVHDFTEISKLDVYGFCLIQKSSDNSNNNKGK